MKRIVFDIVLFLSVFTLPWPVGMVLALMGIFVFTQFYEFLGAGIVMYALYAIPSTNQFIASSFWFPFIISLIFIAVQFLRRYIILYQDESR